MTEVDIGVDTGVQTIVCDRVERGGWGQYWGRYWGTGYSVWQSVRGMGAVDIGMQAILHDRVREGWARQILWYRLSCVTEHERGGWGRYWGVGCSVWQSVRGMSEVDIGVKVILCDRVWEGWVRQILGCRLSCVTVCEGWVGQMLGCRLFYVTQLERDGWGRYWGTSCST